MTKQAKRQNAATENRFPYPYGSDLHKLWGWGHRIEQLLSREEYIPTKFDGITFRPSPILVDAMSVMGSLGSKYPAIVAELNQLLSQVEADFSKELAEKTESSRAVLCDHLYLLADRIMKACVWIAEQSEPADKIINDGPLGAGTWRHGGKTHDGLTAKPWRFAKLLWESMPKSVSPEDMAEAVNRDHADVPEEGAVKGWAKRARDWFAEQDIPLTIQQSGTLFTMKEIEEK